MQNILFSDDEYRFLLNGLMLGLTNKETYVQRKGDSLMKVSNL